MCNSAPVSRNTAPCAFVELHPIQIIVCLNRCLYAGHTHICEWNGEGFVVEVAAINGLAPPGEMGRGWTRNQKKRRRKKKKNGQPILPILQQKSRGILSIKIPAETSSPERLSATRGVFDWQAIITREGSATNCVGTALFIQPWQGTNERHAGGFGICFAWRRQRGASDLATYVPLLKTTSPPCKGKNKTNPPSEEQMDNNTWVCISFIINNEIPSEAVTIHKNQAHTYIRTKICRQKMADGPIRHLEKSAHPIEVWKYIIMKVAFFAWLAWLLLCFALILLLLFTFFAFLIFPKKLFPFSALLILIFKRRWNQSQCSYHV